MSIHDDNCNAIEHNDRPEDLSGRGLNARELPPLLAGLLDGGEFLSGLKPIDLREMSKVDEVINIEGLAVHRIERPEPDRAGGTDHDAEAIAGEPELPGGVTRPAARVMGVKPVVVIEGTLAGAGPAPFGVRVLIPMTHAHIAAALGRMLWPWPGEAGAMPLGHTLLFYPEAIVRRDSTVLLETFIGHWPKAGVGLAIGFDDPALAARLLLEAAVRAWRCEGGGECVADGQLLATVGDGCGTVRLERLGDVGETAPAALAALAEPLFVEREAAGKIVAVSPVWRDPQLPVSALGLDTGWSEAARAVGALPFGDVVDGRGHVALEQVATDASQREERLRGLDRGLVVVPREGIPAPWMRQARRYAVED